MPTLRLCSVVAVCAAGLLPAAAAAQTRAQFDRTLARAPVVESPRDIAFAADGTAFVTDDRTDELIRIAPDGSATVIVDAADTFSDPHGIAIDGAGRIVVAEQGHAVVVRFDRDGNRQSGFTGAVGGEIIRPVDVAVLPDGLVVVEQERILRFRGQGDDPLSEPERWSVLAGGFVSLTAVTAVDPERIAVTDAGDRTLKLVELAGGRITDSAGGDGTGLEEFRQPDGLALRENGDLLVADTFNDRIKVFPGQAGQARLAAPHVLEAAGMERPGCVATIPGGDAERFATCTGVIDYPSYQGERRVDIFSLGLRPQQPQPAAETPPAAPGPGAPSQAAPLTAQEDLVRRGWRCVRRGPLVACRRRPEASLRIIAAPGVRVRVLERRVVRRARTDASGVAVVRSPRRFARARVRTVTVRVGGRSRRVALR